MTIISQDSQSEWITKEPKHKSSSSHHRNNSHHNSNNNYRYSKDNNSNYYHHNNNKNYNKDKDHQNQKDENDQNNSKPYYHNNSHHHYNPHYQHAKEFSKLTIEELPQPTATKSDDKKVYDFKFLLTCKEYLAKQPDGFDFEEIKKTLSVIVHEPQENRGHYQNARGRGGYSRGRGMGRMQRSSPGYHRGGEKAENKPACDGETTKEDLWDMPQGSSGGGGFQPDGTFQADDVPEKESSESPAADKSVIGSFMDTSIPNPLLTPDLGKAAITLEPSRHSIPQTLDNSSLSTLAGGPPSLNISPPFVAPQWVYQDPQGKLQGPFSVQDMQDWMKQGFFPDFLPIRHLDQPRFETLAIFKAKYGSMRPFLAEVEELDRQHKMSTQAAVLPGEPQSLFMPTQPNLVRPTFASQDPFSMYPAGPVISTAQSALFGAQNKSVVGHTNKSQLSGQFNKPQNPAWNMDLIHRYPLQTASSSLSAVNPVSMNRSGLDMMDPLLPTSVLAGITSSSVTTTSSLTDPLSAPQSSSSAPGVSNKLGGLIIKESTSNVPCVQLSPVSPVKVPVETEATREPKSAPGTKPASIKSPEKSEFEVSPMKNVTSKPAPQETVNKPAVSVAPWSKVNPDVKKQQPSLREIQDLEEKKRVQEEKENEQKANEAILEKAQKIRDSETTEPEKPIVNAPAGTVWGSKVEQKPTKVIPKAKPAIPANIVQKTLLDIMKEEEEQKKKEEKEHRSIGGRYAETTAFTLPQNSVWGASSMAKIVSQNLPVNTSINRRTSPAAQPSPAQAVTATPKNTPQALSSKPEIPDENDKDRWNVVPSKPIRTGAASAPAVRPPVPSALPVRPNSGDAKTSANEAVKSWARSALKNVLKSGGVSVEDLVTMLIDLPPSDHNTIYTVCDDTLGGFTSVDPRKFAMEFIKRRKSTTGVVSTESSLVAGIASENKFIAVSGKKKKKGGK